MPTPPELSELTELRHHRDQARNALYDYAGRLLALGFEPDQLYVFGGLKRRDIKYIRRYHMRDHVDVA